MVAYIAIGLYAVTLLLPLYWIVISAFKERFEVFRTPLTPSFSAGWENFAFVWTYLEAGTALWNSLYITASALILTLAVALPAAYGLARARGRIGSIVERVYAFGFLIPGFAALVPTLLLAIGLGMYRTREFIILYLSASAQPLAVILLTQFMRTVPSELEESATIDGASRFRIFRSVYIPLVVPGIATVGILQFISYWNEYLYTLVIVGPQPINRTIQVALPTLVSATGNTNYAQVAAGAVISIIPVFVMYLILNRRLEDALVQGAVKG
ncbi:carbohydrate ABC transporter permease [Agromyces bauzanensis]|uniref:Transporter n=1 Tax=Agromyces bauzanensis TaxID=1308924 RepID=A0A917PLF2_9MICO|nr:carbohydrate ABC transporter permease [Agromyces bauzanensis]GGJ83242.1 transporter [Agromyces bauzanensis]